MVKDYKIYKVYVVLIVFFGFFFQSCDWIEQEINTSKSAEPTESTVLGSISKIEFNSSTQALVNFSDLDANGDYIVALHSYNYEQSDTYAFQLGDSEDSSVTSLANLERSLTHEGHDDVSNDIHTQIRLLEEDLEGDVASPDFTINRSLQNSLSLGSTRTFKVLSSLTSTSYTTVTAELRYISNNFYTYVDVRNADSLADSELDDVMDDFNAVIDDERSLFGYESNVDGDGHFVVLMTQAVNELGATGGGMLTGYFYAADLYSDSLYDMSNEMEIFYSMVPDPSGSFGVAVSKNFSLSNVIPSVLPHEFQHMINYNQHVLINNGYAEVSYLNEGLSHLAEDIYSLNNGFMAETGLENPSRINYYLDYTASTCFTCGSSLIQRGGSYLFLRYLYEQAQLGNLSGSQDGADFVNRLLDTDLTGMENIVEAALNSSDEDKFEDLLGLFSVAVFLSDTGLTTNNRYQFTGINLRAQQDDNRGTVLYGPSVTSVSDLPYSSTIATSGIAYMSLSGNDIVDSGGTLPISISDDMNAGAYIIQLDAL